MHGCDDEITFLMCEHPGTDNASFRHASDGDPEHHPSGQEGPPHPPHPPTFDDITTDDHLYDLIMSSMSYDDQKMRHFGLTPIDEIPSG